MVYQNVEQLELHLAALESSVGKDSGCKSVDIAVRDLMRIGISAREAKQDRARQQSEHRKAVEKAQDLVEPKRKSIQPFITASMASSTLIFVIIGSKNILSPASSCRPGVSP